MSATYLSGSVWIICLYALTDGSVWVICLYAGLPVMEISIRNWYFNLSAVGLAAECSEEFGGRFWLGIVPRPGSR
jgi:hypothetical protein